jgi:hypothetical protein
MSTPFAQTDGAATEWIGGDQSWPLHAGPTAHLPANDANAATQYVQPPFAGQQYAGQQYAGQQNAPQYYVSQQHAPQQFVDQPYQPPHQPAPYYGGPQQPGPQQSGPHYAPSQFPPPAYGTPPPSPQIWQIEEETERFVDHPAAFVPPPAAVAEHSARRRRNVWISLLTGVAVASAVLISGFFVLGRLSDAPASAVVGDCLARSGEGAVVVPCSDKQATFTVLGRLDSRTQVEASMSACTSFTGTTDVYWQGKEGIDARGLVLCLGPAKK